MKFLYNKNIALLVKSFVNPEDPGTIIHALDHRIDLPPIFIQKENLVLITLTPKDFSFINLEDMEKVVKFLVKNRVKVTMMQ